jgi:uncharacterized protein (UPF0276 family)
VKNFNLPILGGGAGLRHEHFEEILRDKPPFNWFEIISDEFMDFGGYARDVLSEIRKYYTVIPHGVCLAIGSADPLDRHYLKRLRLFLDELDAPWTSDHLCFTKVDHANLVDLLPLPFTTEAVEHIVERLKVVQGELERPFLLENVTRYITVSAREMSESEFISEICERSGCGLLLDVTNVLLNSTYHDFDPHEFLRSLPLHRVGQIHLAGWEAAADGTIIDSHDGPVQPETWKLLRDALELTGPTSVLVEWDAKLPSVARLLHEAQEADKLMAEVVG